jgi:predicted nucleic acid-binding protein
VGTAGNLTTDAQIAALAIEHRGVVYSNDSDFSRFADVKVVNPLA